MCILLTCGLMELETKVEIDEEVNMRSLSGVGDRAGQQKFDYFGKHRHWYCSGCTFKIAS